MNFVNLAIILNIILLFVYIFVFIRTFYYNPTPKQKAFLATITGVITILYIIALLILVLFGIKNHNYIVSVFLLFIFSPFIIGHFVRYETLKIYSVIQIICFFASLALLLFTK